MPELQILMSGLAFPESPRWHGDRLWFSDWGAHEVIAVDLEGKSEVIVRVLSFPMCIDRLSDGRLLIGSASDGRLLRREPDGSLVTHADLTGLSGHAWNDIAALVDVSLRCAQRTAGESETGRLRPPRSNPTVSGDFPCSLEARRP